jgi:hypothetical protein
MPLLQSNVKTNVFFGLSSAALAIYLYNNYDNLPSIQDMKNKFLVNNDISKTIVSDNNELNNNSSTDISGSEIKDDLMRPDLTN